MSEITSLRSVLFRNKLWQDPGYSNQGQGRIFFFFGLFQTTSVTEESVITS